MSAVLQASGVVLLRPGPMGTELLVIHRPREGDWSLPKGMRHRNEHPVVTAVRECAEETGYQVTVGAPLSPVAYEAFGRPKTVDYWVAQVASEGERTDRDEVDELKWATPAEARTMMAHPEDIVPIIDQALARPVTSPLVILRHAHAIKRGNFGDGPDAQRPLSRKGRTQARSLVAVLSAFGIDQIVSSDAERCYQTVRRYAKRTSREVIRDHSVSEEGFEHESALTVRRIEGLAGDPAATVLCSHRPVLPTIMATVARFLGADPQGPDWEPRLSPGEHLILHREFRGDGSVHLVATERHRTEPT
jgi:8-oxo-dGTP pyrophosphatase MutT (NUDIX family)/phosphohistidine phosphatase SixA